MFYISTSNDPFINLAIENSLLLKVQKDQKILFLYKNKPSIIMGRFQNPWVEAKLAEMKNDKVDLVRRQSGGGTVYHDMGNLNYSFIMGTRDHQKDSNMMILVDALKMLNIDALASDRSDLKVQFKGGPKKISGSAFKQKKDRSIHHGTMLINTDLDKLNFYLESKHSELDAVGVKSVRSHVCNITDINFKITETQYIDCIKKSFEKHTDQKVKVEHIRGEDMDQDHYMQILDKAWIFGETPKFEYKKNLRGIDIFLEAKKGRCKSLELDCDFPTSLVSEVCNFLMGKELFASSLIALNQFFLDEYAMPVPASLMEGLKDSGLFISY